MATIATQQKTEWQVRHIGIDDVVEAVGAGMRDFRAAPVFGLAFGIVYAGTGWALLALIYHFGMPYLAYPLAMGFTLIAPLAVVGLYAVSFEREAGRAPTWAAVFSSIRSAFRRDVRWMAIITGFSLVIWMDIAAFLLFAFMSVHPFEGMAAFINTVFATPSGLAFLMLGNLIGAALAAFVFSISVTSFPMLFEHDIDFVTAMTTSVRVVLNNPRSMLAWCAIIVGLTVISIASAFVGFLIVLPVVGHATWHLYRRAVAPG